MASTGLFFPLFWENVTWQIWASSVVKFSNLGKKVIVKFANLGKYASIEGVTIVKINLNKKILLKLFSFFYHIKNTRTG
jgi:hypothetical protein